MSTNIAFAAFGGEHDGHSVVIGIENVDGAAVVRVIARGFGFRPGSVTAVVPLAEYGAPMTWEAQMTSRNRLAGRTRNDKAWKAAVDYLDANRYAVKDFIRYRMEISPAFPYSEEATKVEPLELNGYERS